MKRQTLSYGRGRDRDLRREWWVFWLLAIGGSVARASAAFIALAWLMIRGMHA